MYMSELRLRVTGLCSPVSVVVVGAAVPAAVCWPLHDIAMTNIVG